MKRTFTLLFSMIAATAAVFGFVVAWKVFGFTHFFVTDAVGDAREMRGDGAQPEYWRDFVGYLWFYIPVLLIATVSSASAAIAGSLLRRGFSSPRQFLSEYPGFSDGDDKTEAAELDGRGAGEKPPN